MILCPVAGAIPKNFHVTQWFGSNPQYYAKYALGGHNGIDFGIPVGTPLYAPCEGYVSRGDQGNVGYGKFARIVSEPYDRDGTRREVTLAHLSAFVLNKDFFHAGELIGYSGNTGDSTGPHLHLTYKKLDRNGKELNWDNGYHGAIDVSPYVALWVAGNVLRPLIP